MVGKPIPLNPALRNSEDLSEVVLRMCPEITQKPQSNRLGFAEWERVASTLNLISRAWRTVV